MRGGAAGVARDFPALLPEGPDPRPPPPRPDHSLRAQGKKRRDTVCIVLTDDTVDESRIRWGGGEGGRAAEGEEWAGVCTQLKGAAFRPVTVPRLLIRMWVGYDGCARAWVGQRLWGDDCGLSSSVQ